MSSRIVRTAVCALFCGLSLPAATIFTLDGIATGTSTTFTNTVGGLSVTFSTPSDPGGFTIITPGSVFSSLTGNVLLSPGPATGIPLTLAFNSPLSGISLLFSTNSVAGVDLVLNAFNGVTFVGTASASGTIPGGFSFPEGTLSFSGGAFDRIVLSTAADNFAIDNIAADLAAPEPGSLGTLGLGLGLLGYLYRRRSRIGA